MTSKSRACDVEACPPVALIVFNRPDAASRMLARLAEIRPAQLFVIADGAREGRSGEQALVAATREIATACTWECDLRVNFADRNLGCRRRVVSGINWAFDHVEELVILEDDCLPTPSFIRFTRELLDRFREDERIGSICGALSVPAIPPTTGSYYFSRYNLFTGWATWKRAWQKYDDTMTPITDGSLDPILAANFEHWRARVYWRYILKTVHANRIDSWGYRWMLSCWRHSMLGVFPTTTLVDNIGFGADATNTRQQAWYFRQHVGELRFPLSHPSGVYRDQRIDQIVEDARYSKSVAGRLRWAAERMLG